MASIYSYEYDPSYLQLSVSIDVEEGEKEIKLTPYYKLVFRSPYCRNRYGYYLYHFQSRKTSI